MRLTLAPLGNFDLGATAAVVIAFAAYRLHALDASGALAAFFIGTATFGALDFSGAAVLLAFFTSSIVLSRLGRERKRALAGDVGKLGARDAAQVMANGGVAALCALGTLWGNGHLAAAFGGAFAAATADTWGTEIGTAFGGAPRSIVSGKRIGAGLSGGVTVAGSLAELAGACFIAAIAAAFGLHAFWAILAGGVAGALLDSLLGATLQGLRWCPQCRRPSEREPHGCGANTRPLRGLTFLDNDGVNFLATLGGAAVAYCVAAAFP